MSKVMDKMMDWVENKFAPKMNSFGGNPWISSIQEAILAALPATLVGSIASLISTFKSLGLSFFPDLTQLSNFSFGLFGLYLAYLIPSNIMEKKRNRRMSKQAGMAGVGLFLLLTYPSMVETSMSIEFSTLGVGGMLNAIISGYIVAAIMNLFAKHSFFKEDTAMPSFIVTWFDTLIPWTLCILVGVTFTFVLEFNLIEAIRTVFTPVISVGQTFWGFLIIYFACLFVYSFGISSWIIYPILTLIWSEGWAANEALIAQGLAPTNIHINEMFKMITIGGQGSTLALCIFMAFIARSKRLKTIGRTSLIPGLFNINEPLVYGAPIAFNPILMVPFWLAGLANGIVVWAGFSTGFMQIPTEVFRLKIPSFLYAPICVKSLNGFWVILLAFALTCIIYYPFFKIYDKQLTAEEENA